MNRENWEVLRTILAAADTGDYQYGTFNYDYFEPAYECGNDWHPIALGAWRFYGNDARRIVRDVYDVNHDIFKRRYPLYVIDDLLADWSNKECVFTDTHVDMLKQIASSILGQDYQCKQIDRQIRYCLASAESCGVTTVHGQMMWVEFQRLGGLDAPRRIFANCGNDASLQDIMVALDMEQFDKSSTNHIGNDMFGERHAFIKDCIEKYSFMERSNTKEDH